MVFRIHPLANGVRTDHPVPGLPFVDDSHLPIEDGGRALEAVGRNVGDGMWGRYDEASTDDHDDAGWLAFTTDPLRHDLGWVVRYHPDHGRTVLLMRDGDTAEMHNHWWNDTLLFRAGGYWWDGQTWYRPGQVWDPVRERNERRKVQAAVTVSAADLLDGSTDPDRAYVAKVASFKPDEPLPENWGDHLALWAQLHAQQQDGRTLSSCVVNLACPELAGDQLLGVPEMATLAEIAPSTLRAYISRKESNVPLPQATVGGRALWSRPVAADWVEARQRSSEGVMAAMASGDRDELSPGAAAVRERFANNFYHSLWERPDLRRRWALRHRNEQAVREIADELAWTVAVSMERIVPVHALSSTIRHAILDDFADDLDSHSRRGRGSVKPWDLNLSLQVAKMLDWFIQQYPQAAQATIAEILQGAERRWNVPANVIGAALRDTMLRDGTLDKDTLNAYFDRVLPSEHAS